MRVRRSSQAARVRVGFALEPGVLEDRAGESAFRAETRRVLGAAAQAILRSGLRAEVQVTATTDETIRELNREHRRIDRATDVLSFPMLAPEESLRCWGVEVPACHVAGGRRGAGAAAGQADLPADWAAGGALLLGDIVVSIPAVRRAARRLRKPFERELAFVLCHSLLHLLGCDHDTRTRRISMWTLSAALAAGAPVAGGVKRSRGR